MVDTVDVTGVLSSTDVGESRRWPPRMLHAPARLQSVERYPVLVFAILTIAFTWVFWVPLAVFHVPENAIGFLAFTAGAFGPPVAAAIVTWLRGDSVRAWAASIRRWRFPARYWLMALVLPGLCAVGAGLAGLVLGDGSLTLPSRYQTIAYPIQFLPLLVAGGGQEEPGWRGFALPYLQETYSPLAASALIAVPWFVWHLPMWWIPWTGQSTLPIPVFAVTILVLSVLLTWLYDTVRGGLLLVMVFHVSVDAAPIFYLAGGDAAFAEPLGWTLFTAALALVALYPLLRYGTRLAPGDAPIRPPDADLR